ncbi:MAG TPA: ABC transporter substrate-binding protein [Chloroflexota bacterium]|nr:ABC transporter substrate-binding protein [Chloroflexota bacterium]
MTRRAVTALGALLAALLAACGTPAAPPSVGSVESHNVISTAAGSGGTAVPPTSAPAPSPVAIRVHTPSESTSTLPITVAQRLGYYEQEGIDLEQRPMPPNVGMAALLSGDVQFSTAATSSLSAAATGAPVRLVISLAERPAHVLLGAPGLTFPEALRGATIASSSPGGVQYRESQAALRHFGLDPQDATLVALQSDAVRQAALESGAAQAAVLTMPFNFKLEREGYPRLLNFAAGDLVRLPVGALSGTVDYLAKHDDAVVRTLRATLRGLRATRDDQAATVAAIQSFFEIDEPTASDLYDAVAASFTTDGRIAPSAIRDALASGDAGSPGVDPATLVDFSYLDRATRSLDAR